MSPNSKLLKFIIDEFISRNKISFSKLCLEEKLEFTSRYIELMKDGQDFLFDFLARIENFTVLFGMAMNANMKLNDFLLSVVVERNFCEPVKESFDALFAEAEYMHLDELNQLIPWHAFDVDKYADGLVNR